MKKCTFEYFDNEKMQLVNCGKQAKWRYKNQYLCEECKELALLHISKYDIVEVKE